MNILLNRAHINKVKQKDISACKAIYFKISCFPLGGTRRQFNPLISRASTKYYVTTRVKDPASDQIRNRSGSEPQQTLDATFEKRTRIRTEPYTIHPNFFSLSQYLFIKNVEEILLLVTMIRYREFGSECSY